MAPNIVHVSPCHHSDIRVPPIFINNNDDLNDFPELSIPASPAHPAVNDVPEPSTSTSTSTRTSSDLASPQGHQQSALKVSSQLDCVFTSTPNSDSTRNEFRFEFPEDYPESKDVSQTHLNQRSSTSTEEADKLFDSDYVLPANSEWWKMECPSTPELCPSTPELPVTSDSLELVDVADFRDSLSNSDLWDDVDEFVSVVDSSSDDVFDVCDVQEPVYWLDRNVKTVWGLDIIWEEDEE